MNPRPKPWKQGPVHQRIESYPGSRTRESAWYKKKGNSKGLLPAHMHLRLPDRVHYADSRGATSVLHTHLRGHRRGAAYPSSTDLYEVFRELESGHKTRFWHIAVLDKKGVVRGYYSMHAPPRFVGKLNTPSLLKLKWALKISADGKNPKHADGVPMFYSETHLLKHAHQVMTQNGFRFRTSPMPGFRFRNGHFVSTDASGPPQKKSTQ